MWLFFESFLCFRHFFESSLLFVFSCSNDDTLSTDDIIETTNPSDTAQVTTNTYQDYINIDFDNLDEYAAIQLPEHFADVDENDNK